MITINHFDAMAKIILLASIIMTYSYASEWFMAWYAGSDPRIVHWSATCSPATMRRSIGCLLFFNCVLPQVIVVPIARRSILWRGRDSHPDQCRNVAGAHSDHLEHAFARLRPTDVAAFSSHAVGLGAAVRAHSGSSSFSSSAYVSVLPAVSMYETRKLCRDEGVA